MLEVLEAIDHLGEISRLFLILRKQVGFRMEENALTEACQRTAGLSSRYPRPKPALILAVALGLLNLHKGVVTATERGHQFCENGIINHVDFFLAQGQLLLGALLDDAIVESELKTFLRSFQVVHGELIVRKSAILSTADQQLICRLLQQLQALKSVGDYYSINPLFEALLDRLILRASRLSEKELLARLERQRKRGQLAEEKVIEQEKERLCLLKRADLAAKVERISIENVSAGYDIKSFEKNGRIRFIEVKSSVGSKVAFEWSTGEREKAEKEGETYYIYFVPLSFTLPRLAAPIVIIHNPFLLIKKGHLLESPCSYRVVGVEFIL